MLDEKYCGIELLGKRVGDEAADAPESFDGCLVTRVEEDRRVVQVALVDERGVV